MDNTNRILNCLPSKDMEDDWTIDTSVDSGILRAEGAIPESKDLREPS
ncbi:MAG TPA: hypothetical protein VLA74_10430 [Nitrososphaeraceae archaeon]|nr:hypothetical protein [Nitrososphaeraceae archaeon]